MDKEKATREIIDEFNKIDSIVKLKSEVSVVDVTPSQFFNFSYTTMFFFILDLKNDVFLKPGVQWTIDAGTFLKEEATKTVEKMAEDRGYLLMYNNTKDAFWLGG